jgi:large subunit ribosomal protein L31e
MVRIKEGESRTYIVPLRKGYANTPNWRRSKKAVDILRQFIVRHTKVENVKLSNWVNEEVWKDGGKNPPHKIEVKVKIEKEKIQDKKTKKDVDVPFAKVELATLSKRIERIIKKKEDKTSKLTKVAPKEEKKEEGKKETLKEKVAKKIKKTEAPKEQKKSTKELADELHAAEEKKAKKKTATITKSQEMSMKK